MAQAHVAGSRASSRQGGKAQRPGWSRYPQWRVDLQSSLPGSQPARGGTQGQSHRLLRFGTRSGIRPIRDRKSTRLNSSHLGISYAVFCLKKKKNKNNKNNNKPPQQ